ncbi:kinetochore-associated protein NSL1 homolog isoform X1 [Oryzias melastigma]|uniref:kinetochore-associated protein NSL1 homolog isoform X1 n=2 Tax=Oryzias melastigma TaxID=30732 RepID=UPI000CF7D956|nr:kinetochore-associated protein NSL1 homolog isoform X1 [Oryzias melastigma]
MTVGNIKEEDFLMCAERQDHLQLLSGGNRKLRRRSVSASKYSNELAVKMAAWSPPVQDSEPETRVSVRSKGRVLDLIDRGKQLLSSALDGQASVDEETREALVRELLADFEAAVQGNVSVDGLQWEEAPEDQAMDVESLLDETIVETARRRRTFPLKILPHAVQSLKAERKIMGLYERVFQPQDLIKDLEAEDLMKDLSAAVPGLVREAIQVIKSITTLHVQVEDLSEILNMKPTQASLDIHREVFGLPQPTDPACTRSKKPIKRAIEEAAAKQGYSPLNKKAVCSDETLQQSSQPCCAEN